MLETGPQYKRVAQLIKKRILHGDYSIKSIPSERQLARELDVNFMTVRRGLQLLVEDGLIERRRGRMQVKNDGAGSRRIVRIALLVPILASSRVDELRVAAEMAAESRGVSVRTVIYVHWDDPVLLDAVQGFDGAFIVPPAEPVSPEVLKVVRNASLRVVVLDQNLSSFGLPSILQFPVNCGQAVLDHLASLGRSRIACFNTQPEDTPVMERIDLWRYWMAAHGFRGKLYNRPVKSGQVTSTAALRYMKEILDEGLDADAVFCITAAAAVGVLRALADFRRKVGPEFPVAAFSGEGIAELLNPTLTCLRSPDIGPYLNYCLDWMLAGDEPWEGPLVMAPSEIPLSVGESTSGC